MNLSSRARDTETFGQKVLFYVAIHLLFHRYDGLFGICNASDSPGLNLYIVRIFGFSLYFPVGSHSAGRMSQICFVYIHVEYIHEKGSFLPPTFMRC